MAISLSSSIIDSNRKSAAKKLAKQQAKAQKAEGKRKKSAGIFGSIGGALLGAGAVGLMGLTGGLAAPLVMGAATSLGKKWADDASKGSTLLRGLSPGLEKKFKSPGQLDKIAIDDKYGYGDAEAKELTSQLKESRKSDWDLGTMATDIGSAYLTAGMSGGLSAGKDAAMAGDWSSAIKGTGVGGMEGLKQSMAGLIPGGEEGVSNFSYNKEGGITSNTISAGLAVDPSTIDLTESLEGSGLSRDQYDRIAATAQANYTDDNDDWFGSESSEPIGQSYEVMKDGGMVGNVDPYTLIGLALLGQMNQKNTTYSNTALEDGNMTIADKFKAKGKTLGGNNTQSLSQMLGR
jgi:hypothetical protein